MVIQQASDAVLTDLAQADPGSVGFFRNLLQAADSALTADFLQGVPVNALVARRVGVVDGILVQVWQRWIDSRCEDIALVAVGGYGRGELHPQSDIDLLVLLEGPGARIHSSAIEGFLTFLWDIGLHVGHSVRTLHECVQAAELDITVATNLMESRLLTGPEGLYGRLRARTGPDCIWPSRRFFEAKLREQRARHRKFHDTAYNLEPNVKEGPGGLRDIQMVGWVTKRHFGAQTLHDLVAHGFLTEAEYGLLQEGQSFLWKIRFGLHALSARREERLLFDYQRELAVLFGYRDQGYRLGVELFMKDYYQTVMELGRLNEMLMQLFREVILYSHESEQAIPINRRFQVRRGFLEVTHDNVFRRYPFALLEVFLILQQRPDIKGVRASTIRLIREHRYLIDDSFRNDLRARSLFIEILRQPRGLSHEIRRMHRYGVLGAYLPAFGAVIGLMQHDLFHVYTVDEHSLFVVRNLRRLAEAQFSAELPMASSIMKQLPKPELLYVAGLFHDIAKGRGGDHSELGAHEALQFCLSHSLPAYDARLVEWLVRNHLIMSITAQRKDIGDPDVINAFAAAVGDPVRLDYLYLLTVADIRATNPTLWNAWKDALLSELYLSTRRALRRGIAAPQDQSERVREAQHNAEALLREAGLPAAGVSDLWVTLDEDYFLRHSAEEIAWHTRAILENRNGLPLVMVRAHTERGGTAVCVYAPDHPHLFAITTSALDQLGLNIVDARIITTRSGHTLETYMVLEEDGEPVTHAYRLGEISGVLRDQLSRPYQPPSTRRRVPRAVKHFRIETQVNFSEDRRNHRTVMEVIAADRPGLLSRIARALTECSVRLQNAKVATLGARAEDLFFISDENNRPLADRERRECLRQRVHQYVDIDA
jgi:[protein-PII] uridylyltransferase